MTFSQTILEVAVEGFMEVAVDLKRQFEVWNKM